MQWETDYQQLVTAMGDAVVVSDREGKIRFWNPAAERIFGFTETEVLGESLDIIIPEKQRARHWDGYHETMHSGKTRYATDLLRVPAIGKNAKRLSIAFSVALLYSSDKQVSGMVAVIRDETERFNAERELRKRLAELEQGAD